MKVKKIIASVLIVVLVIVYSNVSLIDVKASNIEQVIDSKSILYNGERLEEQAKIYAEQCYKEMVEAICEIQNYEIDTKQEILLGNPYNIYQNNLEIQQAHYIFPIYIQGKIIFELSVAYMDTGFGASIGEGNAKLLERVNYNNEDCIVYSVDDVCYLETEQGTYVMGSSEEENQEKFKIKKFNIQVAEKKEEKTQNSGQFETMSFTEKKNKIENSYKTVKAVTSEENDNILVGYTPAINKGTGYAYLDINNYLVAQNGYNICWAACIATRYRYGTGNTTLTAEQIATEMGEPYTVGFYNGASDDTIIAALRRYGYTSYRKRNLISYSSVKNNINSKNAIILIGKNSQRKHAVTVTGYVGNKYIEIWNPDTKEKKIALYDTQNGSFSDSNGNVWTMSYVFSFK